MTRPRNQQLSVEDSWRMVEGEQDSYDTSIVPHLYDDNDYYNGEELHDTNPYNISQRSDPSQLSFISEKSNSSRSAAGSSQGQHSTAHDFIRRADDEKVILRSPFQPSMPARTSTRGREESETPRQGRSPDPEFYMPTVDADRGAGTRRRSERRQQQQQQLPEENGRTLRRRPGAAPALSRDGRPTQRKDYLEPPGLLDRFAAAAPGTVFDVLGWALGIVGLAFKYAQKPIAVAVAIWMFFGALLMVQNLATKSLYASLSPVCRLPGVSLLELPFCPVVTMDDAGTGPQNPVEFDGLMGVQGQFEEVYEKSAGAVSLPLEMKKSEVAASDLRTMVQYSNLQGKDELIVEFNGFIAAAEAASRDLQIFNTRIGFAVDSVISINRWTSRYLKTLIASEADAGWVSKAVSTIFAPFQPVEITEQKVLDKYVENTALVSDKITDLISEAQQVLRSLSTAEGFLRNIHGYVTQTHNSVSEEKDKLGWDIWTFLGANREPMREFNSQLDLLAKTYRHRKAAIHQVSELVVELEKIQAGLTDLRAREAAPALARRMMVKGKGETPLSVHIETIGRGVERLEWARDRIRSGEEEAWRKTLERERRPEFVIGIDED